MALNKELLKLLACPDCKAPVELAGDHWLICPACQRKYPIKNGIPMMLIEVGERFRGLNIDELPDPNSL